MLKYLLKPVKFDYLDQWLKQDGIKVLDVGCGNHSPSQTKSYYPQCVYYGLDQSRSYQLDEKDFKSMREFYEVDLSSPGALQQIPDNFFGCVILNHVIEHLQNGSEVLTQLARKLKSGGVIYVETPSLRSKKLPSMKGPLMGGCLNFFDDPTHVKVYDPKLIEKILIQEDFVIVKSGIRHSLKRIIFFPVYFVGSFLYLKCLDGCVFWDILGFVQQTIAVKK